MKLGKFINVWGQIWSQTPHRLLCHAHWASRSSLGLPTLHSSLPWWGRLAIAWVLCRLGTPSVHVLAGIPAVCHLARVRFTLTRIWCTLVVGLSGASTPFLAGVYYAGKSRARVRVPWMRHLRLHWRQMTALDKIARLSLASCPSVCAGHCFEGHPIGRVDAVASHTRAARPATNNIVNARSRNCR